MKARIALIAVLTIVIGLQIAYLINRIRTQGSYATPNAPGQQQNVPMAGGPANQPGGGPPQATDPGAVPPATKGGKNVPGAKGGSPAPSGAPGQLPPGNPPAGGPQPNMPVQGPAGGPQPGPSGGPQPGGPQPNMPAGGPGPGPGGPVMVTTDLMPYHEVIAAILKLQESPKLALSAEQKSQMTPIVGSMAGLLSKPAARPSQFLGVAMQVLKSEQLAYIVAHRAEPPPIDPSLGPAAGPGSVKMAVMNLLKKRSEEPEGKQPGTPVAQNNTTPLAAEDLLGGLLKLEADRDLKVTPAQAKQLLVSVQEMAKTTEQIEEKKKELIAILNPAQKDQLLVIHQEFMTNGMGVAAPEKLVADLQSQLQ